MSVANVGARYNLSRASRDHARFLSVVLVFPLSFVRLEFRLSNFADAPDHLAFARRQREHCLVAAIFQPGQPVRVNLAGLDAGGVTFQAAVTDAVAHIVKQTSEQPPKYLVELLFSFRGVSQVEVPADRIHATK